MNYDKNITTSAWRGIIGSNGYTAKREDKKMNNQSAAPQIPEWVRKLVRELRCILNEYAHPFPSTHSILDRFEQAILTAYRKSEEFRLIRGSAEAIEMDAARIQERLSVISIHPEAATISDIAWMAAELLKIYERTLKLYFNSDKQLEKGMA